MSTLTIISRARWGARHDRGFGPAALPALEVWLHHSVTIAPDLVWIDADRDGVEDDEERAMRLLEQIGEDRFGGGISYTFAVMPSGRIYEGHGVDREGAHLAHRNGIARSVVLVGDYRRRPPTDAQVRSVAWLLQHGKRRGWWRHDRLAGGHRQAPAASTECPGDAALATIPRISQLAAGSPITEEDDMPTAKEVAEETVRQLLAVKLNMQWERADGTAHVVPLRTVLEWTDRRASATNARIAAVAGRLDGLAELVRQLGADEELDLAAVSAAAEAGTRKALEEGVVHVDVDVTVPNTNTERT